jgi:hypothetical protein
MIGDGYDEAPRDDKHALHWSLLKSKPHCSVRSVLLHWHMMPVVGCCDVVKGKDPYSPHVCVLLVALQLQARRDH